VMSDELAQHSALKTHHSEFPSGFTHTEELGWIPEEWVETSLEGLGKVVTGKTPPKAIDNAYGTQSMFLTPTDYNGDLMTTHTQRRLSESGEDAIKNSRLDKGSICVTCIGSQMGKTTLTLETTYTNQQINSIIPNREAHRNYILLNLRQRRDEIFSIGASGSTMPIVNKGTFSQLPVLLPSDLVLSQFDRIAEQLIKRISSNLTLTQTLTKLRDTLLPKLISGDLRIPASETSAI